MVFALHLLWSVLTTPRLRSERDLRNLNLFEKLRLHLFETCLRARETGGLSMHPRGVKTRGEVPTRL